MIGTFATRVGLAAGFSALVLLGTSPVQAQDAVKIGVIGPNSGPYAIIGEEVHHGFELYFDEVGNKAGGRPVQIIFEDTQAKPDVGLTKIQKLVERDGVSFIGGIVSSSVAYAVRDYVVEKKMPTVVTVASADGLTQKLASPYIFRTNSSGSQASHPFGKWLYDQGYRRIVLIAPNYAMGYEQTGGLARTFTALGGKVVKTMYPPLGTSDYGSFLASVDKSKVDAVAAVFAGSEALKFVKQYDEYGLKGALPLVGTSLLTDDLLLQQEGDSAIGITTAMHYSAALDTAENKAFVAAYRKKYNRSPTLYSEASYVGAKAIHEALEARKGDTADTAALIKAMQKVSFAAPRGHFSFDDHNSPVNDIYVLRVTRENGQLINKPIAKYPNIGQFYTWKPEEFMKMPGYADIANDWAK